ncbi:hypothetical protein ES703_117233 [subsurface metagenome]
MPIVVYRIHLCALLKEQLYSFDVTEKGRRVQGGCSFVVLNIYIGTFFDQQPGGFGLAENSRHHQGRAASCRLLGI